jgi:recombination protein RecA
MSLDDLKKKLMQKCKGVHVSRLDESDIASVKEFLPTPSYDLNRILSGSLFKGLPSRTFSLMVGPEASFKSSFMCLCAAEAQRRGYSPIIIDTEGAWTSDFVSRWGLDPKNILYIYTPWVDEINVALGQIIDSGDQKLCLIIDSIGGMEQMKLLEDAAKGDVKADQGGLQKKIKRTLKMILNICKMNNSIAMAAGHYHGNPSGYGDAEQVGGGKFAKYAPDIIIGLKKSKLYNKDKEVIGTSIKAITLKNRFYPPFNEAVIEIEYDKGINGLAGMVPLAMEAKMIEQAGAWYTNIITGERAQGELNAEKCVSKEMLNKLDEWLNVSGYSTINRNVEMASKLAEEGSEPEGLEDLGEEIEIEQTETEKQTKRGRKSMLGK